MSEELLAGIVGMLNGAEMVVRPVEELLEDILGDPEAAVGIVDSEDGAEPPALPVDELFKENVGNSEKAVELWNPDRSDALG